MEDLRLWISVTRLVLSTLCFVSGRSDIIRVPMAFASNASAKSTGPKGPSLNYGRKLIKQSHEMTPGIPDKPLLLDLICDVSFPTKPYRA